MARRRRTAAIFITISVIALLIWSSQRPPNRSQLSTPDYFNDARRFPLPHPSASRDGSLQAPPLPADKSRLRALQNRYYEGKIQLYSLSYTLQAAAARGGQRDQNDNVVFAAASLRSVSLLLPIACEMTRWRRNHVHFVFLGRTSLPILDILRANGIGDECDVFWHDARPDYATYSTDRRMEVTVLEVLKHVQAFIHPQALLVDGSDTEEAWMSNSAVRQAKELGVPLIQLPASADESLMWITRLDAGALRAWHQDKIHVLVHSPPKASGSLPRLLASLQEADYSGLTPPSLTIELPSADDRTLPNFLASFTWPPGAPQGADKDFTVRHRVQPLTDDPQSSARFIESFYPSDPRNNHVLLISPHAELSPLYYHYLKYLILNYRHSSYTHGETDTALFGLSLSLLNTTGSIKLATEQQPEGSPPGSSSTPPLLSQSPDICAALYFGAFWAEFHDFLTHRLRFSPETVKDRLAGQPTWQAYLQELIRARGNLMLHPGLAADPDALVRLHAEHAPFELGQAEGKQPARARALNVPDLSKGPIVVLDPRAYEVPAATEPGLTQSRNLVRVLPADGDLPELDGLAVLAWDGREISRLGLEAEASGYGKEFGETVGGCDGGNVRMIRKGGAGDLFCTREARADGS